MNTFPFLTCYCNNWHTCLDTVHHCPNKHINESFQFCHSFWNFNLFFFGHFPTLEGKNFALHETALQIPQDITQLISSNCPKLFSSRWIDYSQVFCLSQVFRRVYQAKQTTPHPRDTTVEPMAPWPSSPNEVWNSMRRLTARRLREPSSWVPRSYEERTSPNLTDRSFWDGFLGLVWGGWNKHKSLGINGS